MGLTDHRQQRSAGKMKQHQTAREQNETPVLRYIDQSLKIQGMVALGGIARANVVDLVRSDFGERDQRWDAQDRRGNEYGAVRQVGSERTHEHGGHGVAGAGEAIISSNARR